MKEEYEYKATRFVYCHKDYPNFHKIIITVTDTDKDGVMNNFVYVQYYFADGEHDVSFQGEDENSTSNTSFWTRKCIMSHKETGKNIP